MSNCEWRELTGLLWEAANGKAPERAPKAVTADIGPAVVAASVERPLRFSNEDIEPATASAILAELAARVCDGKVAEADLNPSWFPTGRKLSVEDEEGAALQGCPREV